MQTDRSAYKKNSIYADDSKIYLVHQPVPLLIYLNFKRKLDNTFLSLID